MGAFKIADIRKWHKDCTGTAGFDGTGAKIQTVYAKVDTLYAVYRTTERVVVQYADEASLASDQRQALIGMNPIKGEINGLINGWRASEDLEPPEQWWAKPGYFLHSHPSRKSRARLFDRRVADALIVGLQGDATGGLSLLTAVKADLVAERTSIARTGYMFISALAAMVLMLLSWKAHHHHWSKGFVDNLWFASAVGALGAFFSIALAIRGRQIGIDLQWRDNYVDAGLRILIGSISAVVLYCLLSSNFVVLGFGNTMVGNSIGGLNDAADAVGGANLEDVPAMPIAIVVAFVAGFSERLVGDMLNKSVINALGGSPANPLAGATASAAPVAKSHADERNPLGKPPAALPPPTALSPADDDDFREGCLHDTQLDDAAQTYDVELPEAIGGVAGDSLPAAPGAGGGI